MNTQNISQKFQDPLFKKHVTFSLLYLLLTLLILGGGTLFINDKTDPVLAVTQREQKEKEVKEKKKQEQLEAKKKVEEIYSKIKPELKTTVVKEGEGEAVESGDNVLVHYTGKLENGQKFDSSREKGNPISLDNIGTAQVIPGWNVGLVGMKKGGQYTLFIPSVYAYGDQQKGDIIKPNSNLVFDIEIVDIDKSKNPYKVL
jgi:FKBP-type peptidyl-prolyl cis-trans isomerase